MAQMSAEQLAASVRRRFRQQYGREWPGPSAPGRSLGREREIAELAEAVADEYCPTGLVEPRLIACAKKITLSFGQYGDAFDGMLEAQAGRFHLYCNLARLGQENAPRTRFTLAHELGHYFIDEHRLALLSGALPAHGSACEYESSTTPEQQADQFAVNLLMPSQRFRKIAKNAPLGVEGVRCLAQHFGTSLTAAAIRCATLETQPCAIVKWNWNGYAWKCVSTGMFQAYFRRTFRSVERMPEDSPTRRALANQKPPQCGYFQAGTTTHTWFVRVKEGQWRDLILTEQAVPLGRYGVLTFLYPEND